MWGEDTLGLAQRPLGVVFYELLTGELPLGRFGPPSAKTPVDSRVDDVVMRTLEKELTRAILAGELPDGAKATASLGDDGTSVVLSVTPAEVPAGPTASPLTQ